MTLLMSGLDHHTAAISVREGFSFSTQEVAGLDRAIASVDGVTGAVMLSTCNRTELYLTAETAVDPAELLCQATQKNWSEYRSFFTTLEGEAAARHLLHVASGLESAIWGEDQIVTQVGRAMETARTAETIDSVLSTLFHTAIAAAKDSKTRVRFRALPASAPSQAVALLQRELGDLHGRRVVVIGNGMMGRLSARLLCDAGAKVSVTLRTYRHGETIVPFGCAAVPYDRRFEVIDGADVLFSATASPHYTLTMEQAQQLAHCPRFIVDLAIPRDIAPEVEQLPQVHVYNVDDLGLSQNQTDPEALAQAEEILEEHLRDFYAWWEYRNSIPVMEQLKESITRRLSAEELTTEETVSRTVELMLGGLKGTFHADDLRECASKINAFTRVSRKTAHSDEIPFRFPIFTDLRGKSIVIIGGGTIARRRIDTLLPFGGNITVISPALLGSYEGITWHQRTYQAGDLTGAALAIAATDQRAVNHAVYEEAQSRNIPVSVADDRDECTFFFPAICTGEKVVAGVVSRGDDHRATARVAKRIRKVLTEDEKS